MEGRLRGGCEPSGRWEAGARPGDLTQSEATLPLNDSHRACQRLREEPVMQDEAESFGA
jgi:hypothetical protein